MSNAVDFTKQTFALITGASRGIGRQIAIDLSKNLTEESCVVLIARSLEGLQETRQIIQTEKTHPNVEIVELDLSKPHEEAYKQIVAEIFSKQIKYSNILIFHNAGQIGEVKKAISISNLDTWKDYYVTNVFSTIMFNNIFITEAKKHADRVYVVNITSLCGYKPFENLAMYGSSKAARDLYFSVLDVEEEAVTVLKYSPGPVKTDMVSELVANAESSTLRKHFTDIIEENTILTPAQTVGKLLRVLEDGKFKSGDKIDYYDRY